MEQAWDAIGRHHPEVPSVIVVVAPGSGSRAGELKLGHFSATRWKVADGERSELLVGGEGLQLGALEVLGTLLHEAAHGVAWVREVQDTSRGGRYHNRRFKALAEEIGLEVAQVGSLGWTATKVRDETRARYGPVLAEIEAALVLWRRADRYASGAGAGGRNPLVCRCSCGRRIQVARATLEAGGIICELCGQPFQPAGGSAAAGT